MKEISDLLTDFLDEFGEVDLNHSGVLGQKHGERRYQYKDGTYTPLGKERRRAQYEAQKRAEGKTVGEKSSKSAPKSRVEKSSSKRESLADAVKRLSKERKEKKERKEADRKRAEIEREAEIARERKSRLEAEERKSVDEKAKRDAERLEKIMKDPALLLKHANEFPVEKVDEAIRRMRQEQTLREMSTAKMERGLRYLDTVSKYAKSAGTLYNHVAKFYNAFAADYEDEYWPILKDEGKKKFPSKKAKEEAEQKAKEAEQKAKKGEKKQ